MQVLLNALTQLSEYKQLLEAMDAGQCPAAVSGLSAVHRAHFAAAIRRDTQRTVVLVCADEGEGDRLARDLSALTGEPVSVLTARAFTFHTGATVSRQWEHRRLGLLRALHEGQLGVLVATVEGLLQRTMSPQVLARASFTLRVGGTYDLNELAEQLARSGYTRCEQVEGVGQFALRGGILDVFSPEMTQPVRAEFFGDELDAMGLFDPVSQRRTENVEQAVLLPAAELLPEMAPGGLDGLLKELERLIQLAERKKLAELSATLRVDREAIAAGRSFSALDRYLPLICPEETTAADFLPPDACVLFSESPRVAERAKTYLWQLEEDAKALMERGELSGHCAAHALSFDALTRRLEDWPVAYLDSFTVSAYPQPPKTLLSVMAKQLPGFGASLETAVADLKQYSSLQFSALVLAGTRQRADNLHTLLREQGIPAALEYSAVRLPEPGELLITVGGLSAGMEYPEVHLAILTEGQGTAVRRPAKKASTNRGRLESFTDLTPGDLVVHEHHGVGRFQGMVKLQSDGVEKDYVKLCYAGTDVLYVPATQLDLVSKYIGGGEDQEHKKLSRLGGTDWEKAKTRTRKAVADLAKGLIQLYAQRQRQPGYAFSADSPWQQEFEDQFEYVETDDQLRCVKEIKNDMERPTPMDRLLCGDVGYGKTEVAFRAIMKCVLECKQAAILAPTWVRARQHYLTALKRFSRYPVNVDVVSRFRTPTQIKQTLQRVQEGQVDILIGTHRLFNRDVKFRDLGLLVVDEEQRFGVSHKEKLKENFRQVDV
ncbi:MAG: DEAD/DEAH box helicase, partial [Oscillospiraceae bacterium]|nr:DEAD/DEAH box helicase [Oscillospiraceae bacterium]